MARYGRTTYRCGGYSSYTGHCGALDCETCHPGGAAQMAREEEIGPLQDRLEELEARMAEIEELDTEEDEALQAEYEALETEADELRSEISRIENSDDDGDDYDGDDYDEPSDYDYDRMADSYERGIYGD